MPTPREWELNDDAGMIGITGPSLEKREVGVRAVEVPRWIGSADVVTVMLSHDALALARRCIAEIELQSLQDRVGGDHLLFEELYAGLDAPLAESEPE